jgi:hypothetical protein
MTDICTKLTAIPDLPKVENRAQVLLYLVRFVPNIAAGDAIQGFLGEFGNTVNSCYPKV